MQRGSSWLGKWSWRKYFTAAEDEPKPKKPPTKVFPKGMVPVSDSKWANEMRVRWKRAMNGEKWWEIVSLYWVFAYLGNKDSKEIFSDQLKTSGIYFWISAPTRLLDIVVSSPLNACDVQHWLFTWSKCIHVPTFRKYIVWVKTNNKTENPWQQPKTKTSQSVLKVVILIMRNKSEAREMK